MSVTPQANTEGSLPQPARTDSVTLGRHDYVSELLRLIGMELYKIRRRIMAKVLGSVAIAITILIFLLISIGTIIVLNTPAENFAPPCSSLSIQSGVPTGVPPSNCPTPTSVQLSQFRQDALHSASDPLRLPTSLNIVAQIALNAGIVLIIILIGAAAGGEFSMGTIRLLFTRGPTRTQFLLSKLGAAIICSAIGVLAMALIGILAGQVLNLLSGIVQGFDFFSANWAAHAALYLLIAMLTWIMFATIAIFFGTLGRSTVAAIVGALTWLFVEPIVGSVLKLAGTFSHGPFGDFLNAIPDYFIYNNFSTLQEEQSAYLFGHSISTNSIIHPLIVIACYFTLFIGLALWLNKRRDITN
jgi:ABC-type transport system involved in multi-copper enzyme maturation permease subunit